MVHTGSDLGRKTLTSTKNLGLRCGVDGDLCRLPRARLPAYVDVAQLCELGIAVVREDAEELDGQESEQMTLGPIRRPL